MGKKNDFGWVLPLVALGAAAVGAYYFLHVKPLMENIKAGKPDPYEGVALRSRGYYINSRGYY